MYRLKRARGCRWRAWLGGVEFNCRRSTTHNVGSRPINLTGGNFFSVSSLMNWDTFFVGGNQIIRETKEWNWAASFLFNEFTWCINDLPVGYCCFPFLFLHEHNLFTTLSGLCVNGAGVGGLPRNEETYREPTLPLICATGSFGFLFFFSLTKAATGWELANTTTRRFSSDRPLVHTHIGWCHWPALTKSHNKKCFSLKFFFLSTRFRGFKVIYSASLIPVRRARHGFSLPPPPWRDNSIWVWGRRVSLQSLLFL